MRSKIREITFGVVTPSYNQGDYIAATIRSVIANVDEIVEYCIVDGESTDQTIEVIKKFETHLSSWVSEPDFGQSDALNKGFDRIDADIYCWLNSDDVFLPGAFSRVKEIIAGNINEPVVVFGNAVHVNEISNVVYGSDVERWSKTGKLNLADYIIQPSSFWTKSAWELTGPLDVSLNYAMDWDWFIRAEMNGVRFIAVSDYFSVYRIHDAHKTRCGGDARTNEIVEIYRRYSDQEIFRAAKAIAKRRQSIRPLTAAMKKMNKRWLYSYIDPVRIILAPRLTRLEYMSIINMLL